MDTVQQTVDTYADMLFRVAWQHLGQREEAEDVVQEALLRFIQHPSFDDAAYEKAWLIRVTINLCRDHQKSAWRRLTEPLERLLRLADGTELPPAGEYVGAVLLPSRSGCGIDLIFLEKPVEH